MDKLLRSVRLSTGHVLTVWDDERTRNGKSMLRYEFRAPRTGNCPACSGTLRKHGRPTRGGATCPNDSPNLGAVIFEGANFGCSPRHAVDSDAALLSLLSFLVLKPGDTDAEYFEGYTQAQLDFCQSTEAESLSCDIHVAEECGGCACALWENVHPHVCPDAPAVVKFQVIDHGEDGSQYFPGCSSADFEHVATGVGDTGAEALEDALESMAQADHSVSPLQERIMREWHLSHPDRSAHASLEEHEDCEKFGCDWNHYVSVRYNVREVD